MFTHHKQSGKQHYREIKGQKEKFFRPFDKFFRPFNFPKRRFVKVLINNRISKYYLKQSETVMDKIPLTLACFLSLFALRLMFFGCGRAAFRGFLSCFGGGREIIRTFAMVFQVFNIMVETNKNLKDFNTFSIDCIAREYAEFKGAEDFDMVRDLYAQKGSLKILGGGSNTVFAEELFNGCVLRVCNKGMEVLEEGEDFVVLRVAAGEVWREFVRWCCEKMYCGLENLAAIYGTVGAAPVQNIGAYGVQVADYIEWVECFDMAKGEMKQVNAKDCKFDYRYSRWKKGNENELIHSVVFRLRKHFTVQTGYAAVARMLEGKEVKNLTPLAMCDMITDLRNSKLPDVKVLGNAGSFFKNPTVSEEVFKSLKAEDENLVSFKEDKGVKLSAAYMIEHCGFKGKKVGNVGMHSKQALVLVNYGGATGKEIVAFANKIIESVYDKYGVKLEIEAHIV